MENWTRFAGITRPKNERLRFLRSWASASRTNFPRPSVRSSPYPILLLAGIAVSLAVWIRLARRDDRLLTLYFAALIGAFLGAKIVYFAAEGWMFWDNPHRWLI